MTALDDAVILAFLPRIDPFISSSRIRFDLLGAIGQSNEGSSGLGQHSRRCWRWRSGVARQISEEDKAAFDQELQRLIADRPQITSKLALKKSYDRSGFSQISERSLLS